MESILDCKDNGELLSLDRVRFYSACLAEALVHVHQCDIIHRDVKPANILIGGRADNAKIADYGISREATLDQTMTCVGTLLYQAPEISKGERYGFAADVFSFALTAYSVCDRVRWG